MEKRELLNDEIVWQMKRSNCFDLIRYFFALSLFIVHFCTICNIEQFWFISGGTRVKAFFTMSGFLVFYSYLRKEDIRAYAERRFRRIVPAYVVCIMFCVLVGAIATTLSPADYWLNGETFRYFWNNLLFLNFRQPELPGVFVENPLQPIHAVNGSLWSMKVEVLFYFSVPLVCFLMKRINKLVVVLSILILCLGVKEYCNYLYETTNQHFYYSIEHQFSGFVYFYAGAFLLLYFNLFIRYAKFLIPIAIALYFTRDFSYFINLIESLSFACILIGFAFFVPKLDQLKKYDNISYGIYLYHFPIIQMLIALGMRPENNAVLLFVVSLVLTFLVASVSWFLIEKPIIKRRR